MQKLLTDNFNINFDQKPIALINLSALKSNAILLKRLVKTKLCFVVKSDGYGHGMVECAREVENLVDYFGVASLFEGATLKMAGIKKPILCLMPVFNVERAVQNDLQFCVSSLDYFKQVEKVCKRMRIKANVHIAVNTGMNRLGVDNLNELTEVLESPFVNVCGVFSHFYNVKSFKDCLSQYQKFKPFCALVKQKFPNALCHICSSGALSFGNEFLLDMVRVGIGFYGYGIDLFNLNLQPVMKVFGKTVQKRELKAGENLLYGNYKLKENKEISICNFGYSNGLKNFITGELNCACMNVCAVEGKSDFCEIMVDAQKVANKLNTVPHHVLTLCGTNCKRIYY